MLDIAHCHSELAVRWRAGWLGQHSRVFAGSVHSQLAMSRTPVSQGWSAATVGSRADTETPHEENLDDRGGLADDRESRGVAAKKVEATPQKP